MNSARYHSEILKFLVADFAINKAVIFNFDFLLCLANGSSFALRRKATNSRKLAFETFVENRFRDLERHRGVRVAEFLAELGVDEVWTRADLEGKGAGYALEARGIDLLITEAATLRELLPVGGMEVDTPQINREGSAAKPV